MLTQSFVIGALAVFVGALVGIAFVAGVRAGQ